MNFKHNPSRKKPRPWYESMFWGPLAIALAGAFIAASVQFTAIVLPIYFGPSTLSDFSIMTDPGMDNIDISDNTGSINISENIIVTDIYPWWIKPYRHPVYVKLIGLFPKGVLVHLKNSPRSGHLPLTIPMIIQIDNSSYESGEYEIQIQATGEDGLIRNCTYFLNIQDKTSTVKKNYRTYSSTYFIDAQGRPLSRNEYTAIYNTDPITTVNGISEGQSSSSINSQDLNYSGKEAEISIGTITTFKGT
jgi:hypothetical protein